MRRVLLVALPLVASCAATADVDLGKTRLSQEQRPDTPNTQELWRYDASDVVEHLDSAGGAFRVHFTRAGRHAVPAADANTDGVPDHVEAVAALYEEVEAFYASTLGFRPPLADDGLPDNGGDARFDVYLLDFARAADGSFRAEACLNDNPEQCTGYMVQENDFAGYAYASADEGNRVLSSHEFFHAIQAAYDVGQGSVLGEGTAVWATEKYDPSLDDFENFIDGYLQNTDRSIDVPLPGPVDPFSYGSAMFFKFLDEKYGEEIIRELWEACENGHGGEEDPQWLTQLAVLLETRGSSFEEAFGEFALWNLHTGRFADPTRAYADAEGYPLARLTEEVGPLEDDALRVFHASVQYIALEPQGRDTMTAALLPSAFEPELRDLRLILTTRTLSAQGDVVIVDPGTEEVPVLDTSSARRFIVGVVNVAPTGDSKKPALCIGDPDEVAECRATMLGTPDAGAPPPDAGTSASSSTGGNEKPTTPFGCVHGEAGGGSPWFLGVALAVWFGRRRSRS